MSELFLSPFTQDYSRRDFFVRRTFNIILYNTYNMPVDIFERIIDYLPSGFLKPINFTAVSFIVPARIDSCNVFDFGSECVDICIWL